MEIPIIIYDGIFSFSFDFIFDILILRIGKCEV